MIKEEAEEYIKSKMCNNCGVYLGGGKCSDNCIVIKAIKALEQEPRKGHWIEHIAPNNSHYYDCSLCGCVAPCTEFADSFLWKLSNFCPDCGADMREVEE